jgi:hypothetical protein
MQFARQKFVEVMSMSLAPVHDDALVRGHALRARLRARLRKTVE